MKFKEYNQKQQWLIPPNIEDEIPKGDICRVIDESVEAIDLTCIESKFREEGNPAYHPKMMLKIILYSYAKGIYSSRKIAQELESNIFYWYLSGRQKPDFRTTCLFRSRHANELKDVFQEVVRLCLKLGVAKLLTVAIDGTKIKANADKEKLRSQEWIEARIKEESDAIDKVLEKARLTDEEEDRLYGVDKREDELPEELRDPIKRREKLRQIKEEMEREDKKIINETDHDARLMKSHDGFQLGYNCQAVADAGSQVILAANVCTEGHDQHQLKRNMEELKTVCGDKPQTLLADAGYFCGFNLQYLKEENIYGLIPNRSTRNIAMEADATLPDHLRFKKEQFQYIVDKDLYICPEDKELTRVGSFSEVFVRKSGATTSTVRYQCHDCLDCKFMLICCRSKSQRSIRRYDDELLRQEMINRLKSKEGSALYKQRFKTSEPIFGNIKQNLGFRKFSLRGLIKTRGEFFLITMVHNLYKIQKHLKGDIEWSTSLKLGYQTA
ncbi:MAG: IS1182 family transposase [Candidatus Margulisiibacteriota bacterium]